MTTRYPAARRAVLAVCALFTLPSVRADGLYDDRFGNYLPGRTLFQGIDDDLESAYAISITPDGRIVLAGAYSAIRLSATGVPDESFGNQAFGVEGMFAIQPWGATAGFLSPNAIARQADGKLLFAGSAEGPDFLFHFAVCRTTADGVPDPDYGENGCATYPVESGRTAYGTAAAIDAAGRLVLGGWGYFSFGEKMVVVRFDANGEVDTSFGTNGRTVLLRFGEIAGVETSDTLGALTFDASGRILVVGEAGPPNHSDFAIARLDADGRLDTNFGDDGARLVDVAGQGLYDAATAVAVQRGGRILIGGYAQFPNASQAAMTVAALTPTGDIDTTFGTLPGVFNVWPNGSTAYALCYGLAVQQDGSIVMAGYTANPNDSGAHGQDMAIVRVTPDGHALDGTFAMFGAFTGGFDLGTDTDNTSRDDRLQAVALQDNRIIAAGGARANWPNQSYAAIRLTQDRLFVDGFDVAP
jgi:uncharacterized delta-60 repeat protein